MTTHDLYEGWIVIGDHLLIGVEHAEDLEALTPWLATPEDLEDDEA